MLYTQNRMKITLQRGLEVLIVKSLYLCLIFSVFVFYKGVILMLAAQVADRPHPWVEAARITGLLSMN